MRIRSICVIKDEADIIEQTLMAASAWSDVIYVIDNGSTDGSWDKLLRLAEQHEQIVPFGRTEEPFSHELRRRVFVKNVGECNEGDWWAKLDADELYIDDPRTFLKGIPGCYQNVWAASFQYYFTDRDLAAYMEQPARYGDDIPVEQKCRYYLNNWSEARFFRFDRGLRWDKDRHWPYVGATFPQRIRLKHYQFRSPQQIRKRIESRRAAHAHVSSFSHEASGRDEWLRRQFGRLLEESEVRVETRPNTCRAEEVWHSRIVPAALLDYDEHDARYVLREELMPKLPSVGVFGATAMNKARFLKKFRSTRK